MIRENGSGSNSGVGVDGGGHGGGCSGGSGGSGGGGSGGTVEWFMHDFAASDMAAVRHRLLQQLRAFSRAGDVVRFHTRPQLQPQNVAAHTYGVLWLLWMLYGGNPPAKMLYVALVHDVPEFLTGDVPGPVKDRVGGQALEQFEREVMREARLPVPALDEEEARLLRLADCLEGMRHCCKERQLGNQLMGTCYRRYRQACRELIRRPHEDFIWVFFNQCWEAANHGT